MKKSKISIPNKLSLEERKTLNNLARHQSILRIYKDIMFDLMVCEIEGWDKTEYLNILFDIINHFKERDT